jgi:putative membrane protein
MKFAPLTILAAALGTLPAVADPQGGWNDGYGHMMGGGFGAVGALMMLVFWGAIIAAAVVAVRWLMERDGKVRQPDALDILKERLARGEIDPEEYQARRKALDS